MLIEEANSDDLDAVASLRLRFLAEHRSADPSDLPETFVRATHEFLRRHAAAGTSRSWLARDDATNVGVVTMLLLDLAPRPEDATGLEGYLINMYVEPTHRRRGVGQQLLSACLTAAADLGVRRLLLRATEAGRPLYAGAGFTLDPSWMTLTR